jgi:hypothetical protein
MHLFPFFVCLKIHIQLPYDHSHASPICVAVLWYGRFCHNSQYLFLRWPETESSSATYHSKWFSSGPPVSSTNKTDRHDITEILLKVALNTIKQTNKQIGLEMTGVK